MMKKLNSIIISFLIIATYSCIKLNPDEIITNVTLNGNGLVLIGNEGNFQNGNASLSSYNENSKQVLNNIYQSINQEPIGDVLHRLLNSKEFHGNKFLVSQVSIIASMVTTRYNKLVYYPY